jgi:hypothetical protein
VGLKHGHFPAGRTETESVWEFGADVNLREIVTGSGREFYNEVKKKENCSCA